MGVFKIDVPGCRQKTIKQTNRLFTTNGQAVSIAEDYDAFSLNSPIPNYSLRLTRSPIFLPPLTIPNPNASQRRPSSIYYCPYLYNSPLRRFPFTADHSQPVHFMALTHARIKYNLHPCPCEISTALPNLKKSQQITQMYPNNSSKLVPSKWS